MRKAWPLLLLLLLSCCGGLKKFKAHFFAMDTLVEVTLFVPSQDEGRRIFEELKAEARRIEICFSPYNEQGEIRRINDRKNRAWAVSTSEVVGLIQTASLYGNETQGAFDITLAPVKSLWGFISDQQPRRPDSASVKKLLRHTGYDKLSFRGDTVFFADSQMRLDLGGIAKGYALGNMVNLLKFHGVTSYCLNAGGDIALGDPKPGQGLWRIGIQHPRDKSKAMRTVELANTCIATSGDYERFFFDQGVRYHHIFDPKTGYPALGVSSATVICPDPVRAVVYSKYLIIKRAKAGLGPLSSITAYTVIDTAMQVTTVGKP